ncbi:MAG: Tetratricopeptide 1 repeat-containing protein [Deltaproteobacteria bacterium]|jgi:tetratricopeptide (TPR) repeat protein|nr:Tetratricopeptide 1 repeat-containing protein [Deltaproteobacteria bacterium]
MRHSLGCLFVTVLAAGCAAHRSPDFSLSPAVQSGSLESSSNAATTEPDSLSSFNAKVRAAVAAAKRPDRPAIPTIESVNPELARALAALTASPTAASERRVAEAYHSVGVLDKANDHFAEAIRLDPKDGWAYDGSARVWRDSGFPQFGLGDAYRAVYRLHGAPESLNTLGTILFALGHYSEAQASFERALKQRQDAAYALNNLCYVALTVGDTPAAAVACRRALERAPGLRTARHNLALTYAAKGDLAAAACEFAASGDSASLQYNLGVVHLALRQYKEAAVAFKTAGQLNPALPFVGERERQALALAGGADARR